MDSRRSMIDKLSARQISDPCRMYGEQSAVRFSEENTFYTISSASRGSSRVSGFDKPIRVFYRRLIIISCVMRLLQTEI